MRTPCSTLEKRFRRKAGFPTTSRYQFQEVSEIFSSRSKRRQEPSAGFRERDQKEPRCISENKKVFLLSWCREAGGGMAHVCVGEGELSEPWRDRTDLKSRCLISEAGTKTHGSCCMFTRKPNQNNRNIQSFHAPCLSSDAFHSSEAIRRSCAFLYIPKTRRGSEADMLILLGRMGGVAE